jgi:phenylpropionate dioxygenase-like ring-hydroxylating dioxygenase large terminal subunit
MKATNNGRCLLQGNFNNPDVLVRSWYPIARSHEVKKGKVRSFDLSNRRIAFYRNGAGAIRALDARCPHLGADLGHGSVVGDGVRCAFHGWQFGPDGGCRHAPNLVTAPLRRTRSYPVEERWGFVWLFNGPRPLFELPGTPRGLRAVRLPSRTIRCHPHLVLANGLDATHFEVLHGMEFTTPPRLVVDDEFRISLKLHGRPRSALARRLVGGAKVSARFTTMGASLAWSTVFEPVRFHVLFSARPSPEGFCEPAVVAFLPRRADLVLRATALMYALLRDDDKILDGIRFHPGYTENDAALVTFADAVDAMEVW